MSDEFVCVEMYILKLKTIHPTGLKVKLIRYLQHVSPVIIYNQHLHVSNQIEYQIKLHLAQNEIIRHLGQILPRPNVVCQLKPMAPLPHLGHICPTCRWPDAGQSNQLCGTPSATPSLVLFIKL